jgi:hypothetical protein
MALFILATAVCNDGAQAQRLHNINTNGSITISTSGDYIISGTGVETSNTIRVNGNVTVNVTLENVKISNSNNCAFNVNPGATVNITFTGDNLLKSGSSTAGLRVPNGATVSLSGTGSLSATGGNSHAAGIGGNALEKGGNLYIHSGTIEARGGGRGAGIGGGGTSNRNSAPQGSGDITINGGIVSAWGGMDCAPGIGGGGAHNESGAGYHGGSDGTITINDGIVKAYNGGDVSAIGVGGRVSAENARKTHLIVNGGEVLAKSTLHSAIGAGYGGAGIRFTMNGGLVVADGFFRGIGPGNTGSNSGETVINGGTLIASHSHGGGSGIAGNSLIINGGSVKATSISRQPKNDVGQSIYCSELTFGSPPETDQFVTAGFIGGIPCADVPDAAANVYGIRDMRTDASGKIYVYLPANESETVKFVANNKFYEADYARPTSRITSTLLMSAYAILLDKTGINTFEDVGYGYTSAQLTPLTVTVINAGSNATGSLDVALSNESVSGAFSLSTTTLSSINADGMDAFTVVPSVGLGIGTWTATVTVSGNNGIAASFDVSFTVNKAVCQASHLQFTPASVSFDGQPHGVTQFDLLPPATGLGNITGVTYNGSSSAPSDAGSYIVRVTIDEGANFEAVSDLEVGVFTINRAVYQASHFTFDLTADGAVYDGATHGVTIVAKAAFAAHIGAITVKYEGINGTVYPLSADVPVNAGQYAVTLDIVESADFTAVSGLSLGTFTIEKTTPLVDDLELRMMPTAANSHIRFDTVVYSYYTDEPQGLFMPTLKNPNLSGLGEVVVKYNGSVSLPIYPGEYFVTADIAEGANYVAVTNLPLGRIVIVMPEIPVISRHVTLNVSSHFASDPLPGEFYVQSGRTFTLTLTPLATLPEGYEPRVTTNRHNVSDDQGGVKIQRNENGTYTVRIVYITESTVITVEAVATSSTTGDEDVTGAARVWSYGGRLYIVGGPVDGRAYIYQVSGVLMKIIPFTAGETVTATLPDGIYVVVVDGKQHKVLVKN